MSNKTLTKDFYINHLGFNLLGDYDEYLIIGRDKIVIRFLNLRNLIQRKITDKLISEPIILAIFINHYSTTKQTFTQMDICR